MQVGEGNAHGTRRRVERVATPFEITVYKLGDKYVAARSNEFGHANYDVE